jgi:hypothetical protein
MTTRTLIARNLASAFLSGAWSLEALVRRGGEACGGRPRWLRTLARQVLARWTDLHSAPDVDQLAAFLLDQPCFERAWAGQSIALSRVFTVKEVMRPVAGAPSSWPLPSLTSPAALADWLQIAPRELDWFAGTQLRSRRMSAGPLCHYTYRWRVGRRKVRLLEVPKSRLKDLQRRLLRGLLNQIPAHEAAHAYRRGRSIATLVAPHVGRAMVVHLDLRDFFPSVRASRVHALFRTAGYPRGIARLLTGLCTNAVPLDISNNRPATGPFAPAGESDPRLNARHLPQGAPTSPALANLCAYRLDCRLTSVARTLGASYTRYADDLVFSGGEALERRVRRFQVQVCRIALEESFEVNTRKSHFMRQGICQQVAGVVLNVRPNVRRAQYDRLKAILTNCVRHGPEDQNRDNHPSFRDHLEGRISHVAHLHSERGRRLRQLFEQICWRDAPSTPTS